MPYPIPVKSHWIIITTLNRV